MAKGFSVPGVVKAPNMAISASTPPTSTFIPIFSVSLFETFSICNLSDLTIAAIPTAFSNAYSPARAPATFCGTNVSTANKSLIRIFFVL
ncbi:hypothetical protein SDC9_212564 [bioreactor metagenome]|uniref:Uncharacterized protein n=1 Tax=bioreactor metagenome TaxID=1076179 RepID=A0A645JN67_9ZZZZ